MTLFLDAAEIILVRLEEKETGHAPPDVFVLGVQIQEGMTLRRPKHTFSA
jgi:hypothetical protein